MLWSNVPNTLLYKVQRMQNICARIISKNFNYMIRGIDLVKSLHWMNVADRSRYFTCLLVFKCLHGMAPLYLENQICFKKDMNMRCSNRTSEFDVFIPPFVSSAKEKSLFIKGALIWNSLPIELKSMSNIDGFRSAYKKHFLRNDTWCLLFSLYRDDFLIIAQRLF